MQHLAFKVRFLRDNWKMIVHLLFRTKRFGVNNQWGSRKDFPSGFGWPWWRIIWGIITVLPIYDNYCQMRFRAEIGFVSKETCNKLFS